MVGHIRIETSNGEGWGLTTNSRQQLIVSDGTHTITTYERPRIDLRVVDGVKQYSIVDHALKKVWDICTHAGCIYPMNVCCRWER